MDNKEKIELLKQVDLYIRGELSQDEIDELWKILLQNPEYYDWFETEVHLQSLIRKGIRPDFGKGSDSNTNSSIFQLYKGWIFAAAAAVILAVGLQFLSLDQPAEIHSLALAEIDPSNLTGADVLRSNSQSATDTDISVNEALASAYEGETDEAIEMFLNILKETESISKRQRATAEMNLGILFYNKGEYEQAKKHFLTITEMEEIPEYQKEQSWWFLGNTYLNLNQLHEARDAVFEAYSFSGRFQSAALSLLKKLDLRLGNIPADEAPAKIGD